LSQVPGYLALKRQSAYYQGLWVLLTDIVEDAANSVETSRERSRVQIRHPKKNKNKKNEKNEKNKNKKNKKTRK